MVSYDIMKVSVNKLRECLFAITLNLKVMDGESTLIDQNFTEYHKSGTTPAYTMAKFRVSMQKCIDDYREVQTIYNSAALDAAITTLEGSLI